MNPTETTRRIAALRAQPFPPTWWMRAWAWLMAPLT